jgi:hypothetical protein
MVGMREKIYCTYCGFKLEEDMYCSECGQTSKYLFECDSLVAEVERLKQERDSQQRVAINAMTEVEKLKQINRILESDKYHAEGNLNISMERMTTLEQQLFNQFNLHLKVIATYQNTLSNCEPWDEDGICKFCNYAAEYNHFPNCEYLEMCGNIEEKNK